MTAGPSKGGPWGTAAVVAASVAATVAWGAGSGWADALVAHQGISWSQPWRLLTGPLVHADAGHLLRDLPIFAALSCWAERRAGFGRLLVLALVLPTVAVLADGATGGYLGLSGAINTLLVVFVAERLRRWRGGLDDVVVALLGAGLAGKLAYEGLTGTLLFPMELGAGVEAAPVAHLVGALAGAAWLLGGTATGPRSPRRLRTRPGHPRRSWAGSRS